eukprot:6173396-Pleurochrysis_carterae.AAC.1
MLAEVRVQKRLADGGEAVKRPERAHVDGEKGECVRVYQTAARQCTEVTSTASHETHNASKMAITAEPHSLLLACDSDALFAFGPALHGHACTMVHTPGERRAQLFALFDASGMKRHTHGRHRRVDESNAPF